MTTEQTERILFSLLDESVNWTIVLRENNLIITDETLLTDEVICTMNAVGEALLS